MRPPIDRYVDSLARRRRPKPFAPSEEDVAVARIAIELAAAGPDAQEPREAFVEDLRRRLAASESAPQPEPSRPTAGWVPARRRVLGAIAAVTAAGVGGAAAEHALIRPATEPAIEAGTELSPVAGSWQTVAAETDLIEGSVLPFDLGAVSGFVRNVAGAIEAVSGTCTHQGCRLNLRAPEALLACPCHGATFTLAGRPLTHPHNAHPLPPLPHLPVRVDQGHVQILAP
jgi:nitrite reductase/ring-hydroxylating ferredoxin subunit